jgi:DNA-directed RNA polymerase specialized sigma24 family protein
MPLRGLCYPAPARGVSLCERGNNPPPPTSVRCDADGQDRAGRADGAGRSGGGPRALDSLLAGYLPLIYNIVGRALSGHADVDDVVQETMLRVVRGLGDLRDPAAFRSWLVAVAIRQMRDHYRARQAAPAADLSDEVPTRKPTSSN